jgi:hypothetical protein
MQFQLPSNLQTELVSYDPVLKKLARESKASGARKKSKYPLGNPADLIPEEIVSPADLQAGIDHINQSLAADRHFFFARTVDDKQQIHAILYHYEGVWTAAWLPPVHKKKDYIYGYTYCFKDTTANRNMLDYNVKKNLEEYKSTEAGRTVYLSFTELITEESIRKGKDGRYWHYANVAAYSAKGKNIAKTIKTFEEVLSEGIPRWKDSSGFFDRIKHSKEIYSLISGRYGSDWPQSYWPKYKEDFGLEKEEWTPSFNSISHFANHTGSPRYGGLFSSFRRIQQILDTPFFRKWIQSKCDEMIEKFNDEKTETVAAIKRPWNLIFELVSAIDYVHKIWGESVPIDYYQNNIDSLLGIKTPYEVSSVAREWLSVNMNPASYFQIRTKYYLERLDTIKTEATYRARWDFDEKLNIYQFRFGNWDDTCSMLNTILEAGKTIDPPKRWRISEFHDHVQAEAWKVKNPNHTLPQDLFPTPVKVQAGEETWTFFQPVDTHQLSQWGQAVRNCVGNASNYAEGVRKKQHFIVLCLVEGKPTFTVQLQVRNGMMSVDQIVSFANKTLSQDERQQYTQAFAKALQEQENRLKSEAVTP